MSDWREELQNVIDGYIQKRTKIHAELQSFIGELKSHSGCTHAIAAKLDNDPWGWEIEIGFKNIGKFKFLVRASEILEPQKDKYGDVLDYEVPSDTKSKIASVILRKVKKELIIE